MKFRFYLLPILALAGVCGCTAAPEVALAPTASPTAFPTSAPLEVPVETVAPAAPTIVKSSRPSLPPVPQMMDNSPRPTFVPVPTPMVRPGQTIIISNARPAPMARENPTLVVSNAPVAGRDLSPQVAAERELVWVGARSRIYHRAGSRDYGATTDGFYLSEAAAKRRGFRAASR